MFIIDIAKFIFNLIHIFNELLHFLLVFISLFVVVIFYTMPYRKPIIHILGELGLSYQKTIKVIWICRKNPRILIRSFLELAIIRSGGVHQNTKWWGEIIKEFIKILDENGINGNYTIIVKSCFDLTSQELMRLVGRYFNYFRNRDIQEIFAIKQDSSLGFITNISVQEGYLAPLSFIMGLQDRYNEDWKQIIDKYVHTFYCEENFKVLPSELYLTFAWLMWGPSYQVAGSGEYYKLIQYGFGDESNSIHTIIKNDEYGKNAWENLSNNNNFGICCSLSARIYDNVSYISENQSKFESTALPFIRRVADPDLGNTFIIEYEKHYIENKYGLSNYFFSAYLWIMFTVESDADFGKFSPERTIIFFEHANLADNNNYHFLLNCLIEKCFLHFFNIFSSDASSERKYRYCLSMNEHIKEEFIKKLNFYRDSERFSDKFKNNINEDNIYSLAEVLDGFDTYFKDFVIEDILYMEVDIKDSFSIGVLCQFYGGTYLNEFPDPNERELLDNMLDYLTKKNKGWYGKNNYHIIIALDSQRSVVGGVILDYLADSNSGVIEFIAVNERHRNKGVGAKLFNKAVELLRKDAMLAGYSKFEWVFGEVNDPMITDKSKDTSNTISRLFFWNKLGFKVVKFPYIQPALSEEKEPVVSLLLIGLCVTGEFNQDISTAILQRFIKDYASIAMRIETPEKNEVIKNMNNWLANYKMVKLEHIFNDASKK